MDRINMLSTPEKALAGGGVLMLIASFLDWFTISASGFSGVGESGWGEPGQIWSLLAILLSIGLGGVVIATRLGNMQMPALPQGMTTGLLFGGGAAAIVVLMLLKAWRISAVDAGPGVDTGFGIGFFLGVIAAAAIAYGGYMIYSAEKAGQP